MTCLVVDANGAAVEETSPYRSTTPAPSVCTQMLIGWGYANYFPHDGFSGNIYLVIAGKGSPSASEMAVLARYLASTAGVSR